MLTRVRDASFDRRLPPLPPPIHPSTERAGGWDSGGSVDDILSVCCVLSAACDGGCAVCAGDAGRSLVGVAPGGRVAGGVRAWPTAIGLGVILGGAMMTRQGLSYTLWGIPIAAVALHVRGGIAWKIMGRVVVQGVIAGGIAVLLWVPFLGAELDRYTADARAETPAGEVATSWTVMKHRILYQDQFTASGRSRVEVAAHNAAVTFLPPLSWDCWTLEVPERGWLFYYLTWPVYLASVGGVVWLMIRGEWRIVGLLLVWVGLMLGPVVVLGNVVYSRYVLAGAVPLLIPAGYLVADILAMLMRVRGWPVWRWVAGGAMLVGLMILPMRQIGLQGTSWWRQTLTKADREQYVTGWTAGSATRKAIHFLEGYALGDPVVIITDNGWGLPADGVWAYLSAVRNIHVYYTSEAGTLPILQAASSVVPDVFMLRKNKWLYTAAEPVRLPPNASVLYLTGNHQGDDGVLTETLRRLNPNLKLAASFYGIDHGPEHVDLFELK